MADSPHAVEYAIHAGRAESSRLKTQAAVMADATTGFLSTIGVTQGWSCLDVGCGTGQVSVELGRLAGPSGHVVGVDITGATLDELQSGRSCRGVEKSGSEVVFPHRDRHPGSGFGVPGEL